MAHAKKEDLEDISELLNHFRELSFLKEKSNGCFYFKSKSVLHFHLKDKRRYAHVFDGRSWQEVDIDWSPSGVKQKKICKIICQHLTFTEM